MTVSNKDRQRIFHERRAAERERMIAALIAIDAKLEGSTKQLAVDIRSIIAEALGRGIQD